MIQIKNMNTDEICYVEDTEWKVRLETGGQMDAYKKCKDKIDVEEFEELV